MAAVLAPKVLLIAFWASLIVRQATACTHSSPPNNQVIYLPYFDDKAEDLGEVFYLPLPVPDAGCPVPTVTQADFSIWVDSNKDLLYASYETYKNWKILRQLTVAWDETN